MIEIKNDWYLVRVEKSNFIQSGNVHLVAYYTNGLIERQKLFSIGSCIPTMIDYEQGTTLF
jgi:hypothetical protein